MEYRHALGAVIDAIEHEAMQMDVEIGVRDGFCLLVWQSAKTCELNSLPCYRVVGVDRDTVNNFFRIAVVDR